MDAFRVEANHLFEMDDESASDMEWSPYPPKKSTLSAPAPDLTALLRDPAYPSGDTTDDDDDDEDRTSSSSALSRVAKPAVSLDDDIKLAMGDTAALKKRRPGAGGLTNGARRRRRLPLSSRATAPSTGSGSSGNSCCCMRQCCAPAWASGGELGGDDDEAAAAAPLALACVACVCDGEARRLAAVVGAMPPEAWLRVVAHLDDPRDVELGVALVARRFVALTRSNAVWRRLATRRWGVGPKWIGPRRWVPAGFDWRHYYRQRVALEAPNALRWEYPMIQGNKPSPRFVQTASLVGDTDIVFIGGKQTPESRLDEIHVLDTSTMRFKEPSIRGEPVPPIARHTATVVGKRVFIIGGYGSTYFHSLSMLDTSTMVWSSPRTSGKQPRHRSNHAAVAIGTKIYVFGGSTDDEHGDYVTLGDLHVLDTETFEWTELTPDNCSGPFPEGRAGHRMLAFGERLYLFGGGVWEKSQRTWLMKLNATQVFDPATRTWLKPTMQGGVLPDTCTFTSIFRIGVFMFACFGQSMRQFTVNDHVYALDTIAMEWRRVLPGGPVQPLSRDMASATVVGNHVYFMGGNCAGLLVDHHFCALSFTPLLNE